MSNVELQLRSRLLGDALSAVLTQRGFTVSRLGDRHHDDAFVIIDLDDFQDPEVVHACRSRGVRVIALTNDVEALDVDDDQIALLGGILSYDLSVDAFVRSLRLISSGERLFPRGLIPASRLPASSPGAEPRGGASHLSPRDRELLSHLLEGHANEAIARHLGTSEDTVRVHLKNLLRKIRVDNRTQAAIWALSNLPEFAATHRGFG